MPIEVLLSNIHLSDSAVEIISSTPEPVTLRLPFCRSIDKNIGIKLAFISKNTPRPTLLFEKFEAWHTALDANLMAYCNCILKQNRRHGHAT